MIWVTMRREDGDCMAAFLEAYGSVDDKTLSTADSQVRVKEHYVLLLGGHSTLLASTTAYVLHINLREGGSFRLFLFGYSYRGTLEGVRGEG